jgi:hypothetical protein
MPAANCFIPVAVSRQLRALEQRGDWPSLRRWLSDPLVLSALVSSRAHRSEPLRLWRRVAREGRLQPADLLAAGDEPGSDDVSINDDDNDHVHGGKEEEQQQQQTEDAGAAAASSASASASATLLERRQRRHRRRGRGHAKHHGGDGAEHQHKHHQQQKLSPTLGGPDPAAESRVLRAALQTLIVACESLETLGEPDETCVSTWLAVGDFALDAAMPAECELCLGRATGIIGTWAAIGATAAETAAAGVHHQHHQLQVHGGNAHSRTPPHSPSGLPAAPVTPHSTNYALSELSSTSAASLAGISPRRHGSGTVLIDNEFVSSFASPAPMPMVQWM